MLKLLKRFSRNEDVAIEEPTETIALGELGEADTVGAVFPNIRHLAVNLSIRAPDNEIEPSLTNRSFGPQSRAYFHFRCKNVECRGGGFDLTDEIEGAIAESRSDATGRRICRGQRPADRVHQTQCFYELNFKIHVSYS